MTQKKLDWLNEVSKNVGSKYRHRRFEESPSVREKQISDLTSMIEEAHSDAKTLFEGLIFANLDPLRESSNLKFNYPEGLHLTNLKGYFGEIIAGYLITEKQPFDADSWKVPAFRFRFHNGAMEQLIKAASTTGKSTPIPGLTSEDCLGFMLDADFNVSSIIVAEAKCTASHDSEMINEAHEQLANSSKALTAIPSLIQILESRGRPDDKKWVDALRVVLLKFPEYENRRNDLLVYVCGQKPKRNKNWISDKKKSSKHAVERNLEIAEVHLSDVEELIKKSYKIESL